AFYRAVKPVDAFAPAPRTVSERIDGVMKDLPSGEEVLDKIGKRAEAAAQDLADRFAPLKDSGKPVKERLFGVFKNFGLPTSTDEAEALANRAADRVNRAGERMGNR